MADNPEQAVQQAEQHVEQATAATEKAAAQTAGESKDVLSSITGILEGVQRELKRFGDYMDAAVAEEGEKLEQAATAEAETEQPDIESPPPPERHVRRFGRKVKR